MVIDMISEHLIPKNSTRGRGGGRRCGSKKGESMQVEGWTEVWEHKGRAYAGGGADGGVGAHLVRGLGPCLVQQNSVVK